MPPGVAQTQAIVRVEQEAHTGTAAVFKGGFNHLNERTLPRMTGLGHRKLRRNWFRRANISQQPVWAVDNARYRGVR